MYGIVVERDGSTLPCLLGNTHPTFDDAIQRARREIKRGCYRKVAVVRLVPEASLFHDIKEERY